MDVVVVRRVSFLLLIGLIALLPGCQEKADQSDQKVKLHILAAASLSDAITHIEKDFERVHPNIELVTSFASSGTLQRQIEQGAPADLFISASVSKFENLHEKNLLHPDFSEKMLTNELVLVTHKSNRSKIDSLSDLNSSSVERISIGVPESVPAGRYAKESLVNSKVWDSVKNKIIYAKDVRQVLSYVETGSVDVGLVYSSDAIASSKVSIQTNIAQNLHTPIIYPAGILSDTEHLEEAKRFFTYLQEEQAMNTFKDLGFKPID